MNEDVEKKLQKFTDKIGSDLKWIGTIVSAILITILGFYGQQIYKLNKIQQDQAFDIIILNSRSEDLKWKQGWLMESSELQREYIEAIAKGEDVKDFFDEIDRMNARIMSHGAPMPAMRSGKR